MQDNDHSHVPIDQICVGLYVCLDMRWFEHPFPFNSFKLKDEEQIRIIRSLGLKKIRYDPARSDCKPIGIRSPPVPEKSPALVEEHPDLVGKRALIEKIRLRRVAAERIECAFVDTARAIRSFEKNLLVNPAETLEQGKRLIEQIADSILCAPDLALQVMGEQNGGEELYFHSLNVTLLSLMLARDLKIPQAAGRVLAMGALLHDVGRREIPSKILTKSEPLTQAERNYYELHCSYGVSIGQTLQLTTAMLAIIHEHHEFYDGSGYPRKLKGEAISLLARIVVIANHYDELCNPLNLANALTPHEALAHMFALGRAKFDPTLLQIFVRCLGVYPPGTLVQLSNGVIGMVVTINTARPMKPLVIVYDATIPKEEAILVDMGSETDLNIAKAIRPAQLSPEVYRYLSPRQQVSYYFNAGNVTKLPAGIR